MTHKVLIFFMFLVVWACGTNDPTVDPIVIVEDSELPDLGPDLEPDTGGFPDTGDADAEPDADADLIDTAAIDRILQKHADQNPKSAVGIAIVTDGETAYANAMGTKNSANERADETSLFSVGSVSKMLTGYAVVALADQNVLSLEDPVSNYVTYFHDDTVVPTNFDVRSLLEHSSGIGSTNFEYYGSLDGAFREPFVFWAPPHAIFNYSNMGYNLAGLVAAEARSTSFAEVFSSTTAADFGFPHSTANRNEAEAANHVKGYLDAQGLEYVSPIHHDDYSMPSGGIWMSAVDLAQLLHGILKNVNDPQVRSRIETWIEPRWETRGNATEYAYGLFHDRKKIPATLGHPGQISAYVTSVETIPELGIGVAVVASQNTIRVDLISAEIFEALGVTFETSEEQFVVLDHDDIVGSYRDPNTYGDLEVRSDGTNIMIDMIEYGITNQTLTEFGPNYFFYFDPVWNTYFELTFWPGADGKIEYVASRLGVATKRAPQ